VRVRKDNGRFSVHAISGTYVVLLGINAKESATKGLLGFAVYRTDHTENEAYWIQGFRTFEETLPNPAPGALVSTHEHPVQAFLSTAMLCLWLWLRRRRVASVGHPSTA